MNASNVSSSGWRVSRWAAAAIYAGAFISATGTALPANAKGVDSGECDTPSTPFCDALMNPLPGWPGHVFKLSQNYPDDVKKDYKPWLKYDPITDTKRYILSALTYFYEGNIRGNPAESESNFDPALNSRRNWYHAPWQDHGKEGREFIHGLTRERVSEPLELAKTQKSYWNNYAVGFYNEPGGVTFGKVWKDHGKPDPNAAIFPEGTVSGKLLFTTATPNEVPYLAGAPEWKAYVYCDVHDPNPTQDSKRCVTTVRLLQIDIAVKDNRSPATGWVFGTFVYGGAKPPKTNLSGSSELAVGDGRPKLKPLRNWEQVYPVGVMWGNDPGYTGSGKLTQTWLNPDVKLPHYGYQNRLNGPVDNPRSACMSCHSTSQWPLSADLIPPKGASDYVTAWWFRNIPSGTPFGPGMPPEPPPPQGTQPASDNVHRVSLDYSLQLAGGIRNFYKANQQLIEKMFPKASADDVKAYLGKPVTRSGDE
ncbi:MULTISPECIES: hypothetical protein [Burkholderia]|uniref:Cytochrome c domain-containing protein n=1 Tax=Burkholderia lata (strain ATCC 17760 / DSM 23089 / LMG 22485 / NCIMB 9086 / R18194 / 383) TaxID=482957 RepID=A0A6P2HEE5_BURL3|nr:MULTISPECIES: hypothetical protein [Burkholderia]MBN3797531.1 hypothetical protein [Burkholderia sp. Ac-20392]VWB15884.1 hypothetical protein BLA6860_00575 [Burkholderia lata]VWB20478.1 hypothetical protein BLA6863_00797 [Burkholderia lata]